MPGPASLACFLRLVAGVVVEKMIVRLFRAILIALLLFMGRQAGFAQSFIDLTFERSVIVSSSPTPYGYDTGTADVPGWTEYDGTGDSNYTNGMTVLYNDQTLDLTCVALEGTNYPNPAIQGRYSIFMFGSDVPENGTNGAAIGQTGQIPLGTESLTYWANGLQVSFDGQVLPSIAISNAPNYTVYAVDVSAYAGQTGELLFTAPLDTSSILDDIQFSSSPVPEPGALALSSVGGLVLTWRWRKR